MKMVNRDSVIVIRKICLLILVAISSKAHSQWSEKVLLGNGGEPTVSTDGLGNVFATCHLPSCLYISRDWGKTFKEKKSFTDSLGDVQVLAWTNGRVHVVYMLSDITGMTGWYSSDSGKTFKKSNVVPGPLDREWVAADPKKNILYMNYSNGYIGGPKSKGVFLAISRDEGATFSESVRIDKEAPGDYPVDPYLVTSSDGRIYAMWTTSKDYDTIDRYRFAYSDDGGKTFTGHRTIGELHKKLGTTQERWMLGTLVASGPKTVMAIYQDYQSYTVDGVETHPLTMLVSVSNDGGATFSEPKPLLSDDEMQKAIRQFRSKMNLKGTNPTFIQTEPWASASPNGTIHVVWQDNRDGHGMSGKNILGKWHVRYVTINNNGLASGESERVSPNTMTIRPPLDFISCAADSKYVYAIWSETPNNPADMQFSGNLYIARKEIK